MFVFKILFLVTGVSSVMFMCLVLLNWYMNGPKENPFIRLTGFQRDLLCVIRWLEKTEEEVTGIQVKNVLESKDHYAKEIHHGRLYPNLDTLVDKGLVEKESGGHRFYEYHLTKRGEREINLYSDFVQSSIE